MPLKIMCAGCRKDEREPAEAAVKAALGQATGTWTVSLVKIGRQWSLTVDGPEVKHKTLVVPDGGIKQAIQELLRPAAPAPAPRAPLPSVPPASPPARSAAAPRPAAPVAPSPRAPLPPSRTASPPRSTAAPAAPAATPARPGARPAPDRAPAPPRAAPLTPSRGASYPSKGGERQDRYECQFCSGAFVVIYEAAAGSSQETVAVACPHCWKNSHVMVDEEAALTRDYRAEKA